MAEKIAQLAPRAVLVTEYPVAMFDKKERSDGKPGGEPGGGCGIFTTVTMGVGLISREGGIIEAVGTALNDELRKWCQRRREDHQEPYYFVDGIADRFKRHGYCSGQSYWRFAEDSFRMQLDGDGTMHPNDHGHQQIAFAVAEAMESTFHELGEPSYTGRGTG